MPETSPRTPTLSFVGPRASFVSSSFANSPYAFLGTRKPACMSSVSRARRPRQRHPAHSRSRGFSMNPRKPPQRRFASIKGTKDTGYPIMHYRPSAFHPRRTAMHSTTFKRRGGVFELLATRSSELMLHIAADQFYLHGRICLTGSLAEIQLLSNLTCSRTSMRTKQMPFTTSVRYAREP